MISNKKGAVRKKEYLEYYKNEKKRVNLAMEVIDARKSMKLSQSNLAKKIGTTQTVISNIENANTDIGFELLNKIIEKLNLNSKNLVKIFECKEVQEIEIVATAHWNLNYYEENNCDRVSLKNILNFE
jgi:transcriptional regulator with XRE-family HTH domain